MATGLTIPNTGSIPGLSVTYTPTKDLSGQNYNSGNLYNPSYSIFGSNQAYADTSGDAGTLNLNQALNSGGLTVNATPLPSGGKPQTPPPGSALPVGTIQNGWRWTGVGWEDAGGAGGTVDQSAQIRNDINSGYNNYFNSLDDILNNVLPGQKSSQETIANSQYNQGLNTLQNQFDTGNSQLDTQRQQTTQQQAKSLADLADNIRNSFQAGNVYLGSRGAGDSSAANQYAYALTKLGTQQRGQLQGQFANIFNDINNRATNLQSTFNTEKNNLHETLNQQVAGIAQWFGEQQNALKQAQAQGKLNQGQDLANLSKDLLNTALSNLQNVQANAQNRYNALVSWATSNAQNIQQLRDNLSAINATPLAQAPSAQPLVGTPEVSANGNYYAPIGFGTNPNQKTDIFGNPIRG